MKSQAAGSPDNTTTRVAACAATVAAALRSIVEDFTCAHSERYPAACRFWARRLATAEMFRPEEVALAVRLLAWPDAPSCVHELGFGVLALLLAPLGFEVLCFENDPGYRAVMSRLFEQLARTDVGGRARFAERRQDRLAGAPPEWPDTLALMTEAEGSAAVRRRAVRRLAPYECIVFKTDSDPSRPYLPPRGADIVADLCGRGFVGEALVESGAGPRYLLLMKASMVAPLPPPFHRSGDRGWTTLLPDAFHASGDSNTDPYRSDVWVLQDGVAIGPPHAQHFDVRNLGEGRYSHWTQWLNFSTPDNSDPHRNGRRYAVARVRSKPPAAPFVSTRNSAAIDLLADILASREVKEIAYFHTDHFEPWLAQRAPHEWWQALRRFAALTRDLRFGGKLSLFYSPLLIHQLYRAPPLRERWRAPKPAGFRLRGDGIYFRGGGPDFLAQCREHLAPLESDIGHEFQVHIHHEGWTRSDHVHPEISGWMDRRGSLRKDSRRLDFFVGLCRKTMAEELGRSVDRWAFAHGNWSLNAADPKFCNIVDEIAILRRHGCYGDFTFPAGMSHCDPSIVQAPFTCRVRSVPKAYDRAEGAPRPIIEGGGDLSAQRFLIWNSPIKAARTSLDLWFPNTLRLLAQPEFLLRDWLGSSVAIGNCLYIKTHAHSVDQHYRLWEDDSTIPHTHAPVQRLFDLLERVADKARVPVTPMTVDDVFARLTEFDRKKSARRREAAPQGGRATTRKEHIMSDTRLPPSAPAADERTVRRAEQILLEAMPAYTALDDGYYGARVARGAVLEPYEWEILEFARRHLDPGRVRFIEAGAGWGLLCILLAVAGFEVIGLTGEPQYCEVMRKLAERLDAAFPNYRRRLRVIEGFFPFALENTMLDGERENWLISTNVIHEFTSSCQDAFLAKASLCDHAIFDLATFARDRDAAEQASLKAFIGQGFEIETSLWDARMLLMKPREPRRPGTPGRIASPKWLVGETAYEMKGGPVSQEGHCWSIELPREFAESGDSVDFPKRSPWRLLEDGVLLGPPHSMHSDIAVLGRGRYSHWNGNLYFSASDNSHPATNWRKYTLARAVI